MTETRLRHSAFTAKEIIARKKHAQLQQCHGIEPHQWPSDYTFEQIRMKRYRSGGDDRFDHHVDVTNHDNKIDRRDELFAQLQVWNDLNQEEVNCEARETALGCGEAQSGELQSLDEAGITSIDLNYVSTNINVNGNLLTEASKYTDTAGNKELAADIQLATDAKDTRVDIEDIPNFTIDPITHLLPQLRGSGLVYDSFIRYNMDPEFKAIAVTNNQIHRKAA